MANNHSNRFALFATGNDNTAPNTTPGFDPSNAPLFNQVEDDSWQVVRQRGPLPPAVQPATHTSDHYVPTRPIPTNTSSVDVSDKADDPHENWCGVCFVKFGGKAILQMHMKQSPAKHQHYCNLCKRVFKDQNGIKNHVENSKGHEVSCNVCFSAFNGKWALKCHFDTNPSGGHQFACFTCLLGFRSQTQLESHLQSAPSHIYCGPCDRWFHNNKQRDQHWQTTKRK